LRKINAKMLILPAVIIGSAICAANPGYAEVVDKIAIVVNDEIICDSEIEGMLVPVYDKFKTVYSGEALMAKLEDARQKAVERLIEDRLVLSEAKKQNITVDDREVEEKVADAKRRFGSQEVFEEALASQRLTLKELKGRYREQIMTRKMMDMKVGSTISITPVEVNNYYNNHLDDFSQEEALKLRNILIRVKEGTDINKALELAREISGKLKEGGDFSELASSYSEGPGAQEGGLMGYVKRGDLLPEIEKAVFNMNEGEVSDVIQTSLGYHIFKIDEKRPARTLTLNEARRDVEEALYREKTNEKVKGWIEGLKKNAYIAFK